MKNIKQVEGKFYIFHNGVNLNIVNEKEQHRIFRNEYSLYILECQEFGDDEIEFKEFVNEVLKEHHHFYGIIKITQKQDGGFPSVKVLKEREGTTLKNKMFIEALKKYQF